MKPAKIFKINGVDQNFVFQLLNEKAVALIVVMVAGVLAFFYGEAFSIQSRIIFVSVVGFLVYVLMSIEIEGQKLYGLIPKLLGFIYYPKSLTALKGLEFRVTSNTLVLSDRLIQVFRVEPIDYLLLDDDEKDSFVSQIQLFLNNLRENQIQLIVKNREAVEKDYLKHFDSVDCQVVDFKSKTTFDRREKHLNDYKENLKSLVENNIIPIRDYYLLIKIDCQTNSLQSINRKMKELDDLVDRICRNLRKANIQTRKVLDIELDRFLNEYLKLG